MSKIDKLPENIKDRSKKAIKNIEFAGGAYKHHKRTQTEPLIAPKSHTERVVNVLDRLDKAGIRPYRSPENTNHSKRKIIATTAGSLALFAGSFGLGKIAPEGVEPPSPVNMPVFENDPLQSQYKNDPNSFEIVGGELQQLPSEHLGTGAEG